MSSTLQNSAHVMIARWGGVGQLIRSGTPRDATMAIMDYTPQERAAIAIDGATKIRVSVVGLSTAPNESLDTLDFNGKHYKIMMPPRGPRADGDPVYYDLDCMIFSG